MSGSSLPPSSWLPPEAVRLLQDAARTPVTDKGPLAREKAVNAATAKVKRLYPQYFK